MRLISESGWATLTILVCRGLKTNVPSEKHRNRCYAASIGVTRGFLSGPNDILGPKKARGTLTFKA